MDSADGTSPVIRACCAVILAAEEEGLHLSRAKMASAIGVTTVGFYKRNSRSSEKRMSIAIYDILSENKYPEGCSTNLVPFVFDDLFPLESWKCMYPKVTINGLVEKTK